MRDTARSPSAISGRAPTATRAPPTPTTPWMRLEMMTTNVTNRRAERLPQCSPRVLLRRPTVCGGLFPERRRALARARTRPPLPTRRSRVATRSCCAACSCWPLRPLPEPADLPVSVATRMSLSLPVLLSAVPLWRVDCSREQPSRRGGVAAGGPGARRRVDAGGEDDPSRGRARRRAPRARGRVLLVLRRRHLEQLPRALLRLAPPAHPTFGLNLRRSTPTTRARTTRRERLDGRPPRAGILDWWYRFLTTDLGIFPRAALVRTMQNRVDEAQMRAPGTAIASSTSACTEHEGGMNLTMPEHVIRR